MLGEKYGVPSLELLRALQFERVDRFLQQAGELCALVGSAATHQPLLSVVVPGGQTLTRDLGSGRARNRCTTHVIHGASSWP